MSYDAGAIVGKLFLDISAYEGAASRAAETARRVASTLDRDLSPAERRVSAECDAMRHRLQVLDAQLRTGSGSISESGDEAVKASLKFSFLREKLNFVGNALREVGEAAGRATEELRLGNVTVAEGTGEFARGLPVLGSFIRGFDGLKEAITGANASIKATERDIRLTTDATNAMIDALKVADAFRRDIDRDSSPRDLDQDIIDKAESAKQRIEQQRVKERNALLEELDQTKDRSRKDRLLQDIGRVDEVARVTKARVDEEARRGLIARNNQRFSEAARESSQQPRMEFKPLVARSDYVDELRRSLDQQIERQAKQRVDEFRRQVELRIRDIDDELRRISRSGGARGERAHQLQEERIQLQRRSMDAARDPGSIDVHVSPLDPDRVGQAVVNHLAPVTEQQIRAAEAGAKAARFAASARRNL